MSVYDVNRFSFKNVFLSFYFNTQTPNVCLKLIMGKNINSKQAAGWWLQNVHYLREATYLHHFLKDFILNVYCL